MDQMARQDIAAAAAAHDELGRDYDGPVAEGLVERIGEEIDKRVDARLGQRDDKLTLSGGYDRLSPAARPSLELIVLGLGSMTIGGLMSVALVLHGGPGNGDPTAIVVLMCITIGIINVAYARRR